MFNTGHKYNVVEALWQYEKKNMIVVVVLGK